ncbi:hypothetical protein SDRG_09932 [Saprolegnia diclina VS20]|uniref:Uncharacterized protein n=1 Tax=Saprolegnia diclina (strain VS20) TaxID=1156394 RepID=T0Q461_SAPDV|nr:hypothetical protein SDRG_09932 [Saprolegnia diclina VS20]EQC32619.1 hypothetical protein SDRG_09932 [Saprolegnia diclina VS20]|eukprot:XP_008614120.1 hypothetical protein SDRG_09932 [Saprolegnia diclina VS20]
MVGNQEVALCVDGHDADESFLAKIAPTFEDERDLVGQFEHAVGVGQRLFHELYAFRSCARALPNVSDAKAYRAIFDVLRPQMRKLQRLCAFCHETTILVSSNMQKFTAQDNCTRVVPDTLLAAFVSVLDVLFQLNQLYDIKSGLRNDFSVFKRAFQSIKDDIADAPTIASELQTLQEFLGSASHPKGYIFNALRHNIHNVKRFEHVICLLLKHVLVHLEKKMHLAHDKFAYLRVLPYFLLVLDKDGHGKANAFKGNKAKLEALGKFLRRYPVLPVYADMTLRPATLLQTSSFAFLLPTSEATPEAYALAPWRQRAKKELDGYLPRLALALLTSPSDGIYDVVLEGLQLLVGWKSTLEQGVAWKLEHPAAATDNQSSASSAYERVTKFNYLPSERDGLIELIVSLKSLGHALRQAHALHGAAVHAVVYSRLQTFAQHTLLPTLHRADKKKKQAATKLLHELRVLVGDFTKVDPDDYKRGRADRVLSDLRARAVAPTHGQLLRARTLTQALYDKRGGLRSSASWSWSSHLDADVAALKAFYSESFFFTHLCTLEATVARLSSVGDLWYREFYLDLTKCVQFPTELSMPWILLEHDLTEHGGRRLGWLLDVYNDAADIALRELRQQHLYDEVEAETTLSFDQLVFLLGATTYASARRCGEKQPTALARIATERRLSLLGRSLDVNALIGDHVQAALLREMESAVARLEGADLMHLVAFATTIDALQHAHARLCTLLPLDPFDAMLHEVLDTRVLAFARKELFENVLPRYGYDALGAAFHASATGYIGRAHLATLVRFIGVADLCRVAQDAMRDVDAKIQDVLPLCVHALVAAVPPCSLPKFLYKTEGCLMYFEGKFQSVLQDADLKGHLFQCFRELGNTLALLSLLDETTAVMGRSTALLPYLLEGMTSALGRCGFLTSWGPPTSGGYCHAWGALEFLLHYTNDVDDGVAVAGATLLQLLKQRERYALCSSTQHLLHVQDAYNAVTLCKDDGVGRADDTTTRRTLAFVAQAKRSQIVLDAWLAGLEMLD